MTLDQIILYLRSVAERSVTSDSEDVARTLAESKAKAVAERDEQESKRLWCLQETLRAQNLYLQAFKRLKDGEFYLAWCDFEQIEIALASLERHLTTSWADYRLDSIKAYTEKWQSLYPYKMFISPEMVQRAECSICHRAH